MLGIVLPAFCLAQIPIPLPLEKKVEAESAKPQTSTPVGSPMAAAAEAKEAGDPKQNTPATTSPVPNFFADLWRKLNLDGLWKNNGLMAWVCLLGYIFAGMVLGKIVSIFLLKAFGGPRGSDPEKSFRSRRTGKSRAAHAGSLFGTELVEIGSQTR